MPIRSVDLQTLIPKIPEVQKTKSVEAENMKNNLNINIHKEQQQQEKNTRKVNETKKPYDARISRENQKKQQGGGGEDKGKKEEEGSEEKNEGKEKPRVKIDVRI